MDYSESLIELISTLTALNSNLQQLELELLKDYSTTAVIQIDVPQEILDKAANLCNVVDGYCQIARDINNTKRGN